MRPADARCSLHRDRCEFMADVEKLVVFGVGLLGGSIARAALARGACREVVGLGRDAAKLAKAERAGTITRGTTDVAAACHDADLIVVCTPVDRIAGHVLEAAAACNRPTLITDAGSTKGNIVAALLEPLPGGCRFVGSHPLAGSEKTGAEHATEDLFVGRTVVLTPMDASQPADVERLEAFWSSLGARARRMSARDHDEALAQTSHLPHIVAAALVLSTAEVHLPLVASGWLDTTRIAAGDAALWQSILSANRESTLIAVDAFEKTLSALRKAIEGNDVSQLIVLLSDARIARELAGTLNVSNDRSAG